MFVNCGWEMNWRNDPHTSWTISAIFLYVHLKNIRCLQRDTEPMTSAMQVQCSNHLSNEPTQIWRGQFVELICSLLTSEWLHGSVGKSTAPSSQRSWIPISLKTPKIFNVHIILWDNRWDCSASVSITSSIQLIRIIRSFKQVEKRK